MSEESEKKSAKTPSYHAYSVREGKEKQSFFNRVGAAFPHKDGKGHNIILESVPVDGRITLRTPSERLKNAKDGDGKDKDKEADQERE